MTDADDFEPAPESPESFETAVPVRPAAESKPITRPARNAPRDMPASEEAEQHVLACCLLDNGETLKRARDSGITADSFFWPRHQIIFATLLGLAQAGQPVMLETLYAELTTKRLLEQVGGMPALMQMTSAIPTTAHAGYFIEKVREKSALRAAIKAATQTAEEAYQFTGGLEEFLQVSEARLAAIRGVTTPTLKPRSLFDFRIAIDGDPSILLGDRYLNRGDGAVVVSSSGMGKSAIAIQMAVELTLQKGPFGIHGNGKLRCLIVQSEDSDGDVAEVAHSMRTVLQLTDEQVAEVNERVKVVTDRVNRGPRFIAALRKLIADFKPDLVFINPLQAFIDGDVTDSRDLGTFLREGLNSLNEPATFAYILIHHTTKPATGKERSERLWHEVMYDMAGGAEIINWARAILSLRATPKEGEFNLVLAKRGRRAGVTRQVPQGVGFVLEPVTTIPLKHSTGRIEVPGMKRGVPVIYWLPRETADEAAEPKERIGGRGVKFEFHDYETVFPKKESEGLPLMQLISYCQQNGPVSKSSFPGVLKRWEQEGFIEIIRPENGPMRYRRAK